MYNHVEGHRHRVLHVDDDDLSLRRTAALLTENDYQVTSLVDPLHAMDAIARQQYRFVVIDVQMPIKSGLQLLREIKRLDAGIQVIIYSMAVRASLALEMMSLGAEAFVLKSPAADHELLAALQFAVRRHLQWTNALRQLTRDSGRLSTAS